MANRYQDPRRTATLSFIAYAGFADLNILRDDGSLVKEIRWALEKFAPDQSLVWGPAFHRPDPIFDRVEKDHRPTDALVFVVKDGSGEEDYTVVIRGTNPIALQEWLFQDLMVYKTVAWDAVLGPDSARAPGALVSLATQNAVATHTALEPQAPAEGSGNLLSFLSGLVKQNPQVRIGFTGHSLGGLMAPVLACWVCDQLNLAPGPVGAVGYAGPTAGNPEFNTHLLAKVPDLVRYANPKDIAVAAWDEKTVKDMPGLYGGSPGMQWPLTAVWDLVRLMVLGKGYQQPGTAVEVASQVQSEPEVLAKYYLAQAVYQHVFPYLALAGEPASQGLAKYF